MRKTCSGCGTDITRGKFCPKCGIENTEVNNAMQDGVRGMIYIILMVLGVFGFMAIITLIDSL